MSSIAGPVTGSGSINKTATSLSVGLSDLGAARQGSAATGSSTARISVTTPAAVTSTMFDAGAVPVDQDRVATIRKAIADHAYPLVPTKIGDAMIAAGMLLRMGNGGDA